MFQNDVDIKTKMCYNFYIMENLIRDFNKKLDGGMKIWKEQMKQNWQKES